ncbi:MAG: ATP-binding protein [Firmicutes bacterium]|uniref:Mg-protoporphyrin IX chelatase n=1 Tax=Sulfobacillus benefaciens TaxID=453960 RepID=A0A2T2WY88_9FIRM|nr:ATP-binding protein [Bacillota bacterium]PSR27203.1 MAG: hypothetical protein C7B43_12140 [Sulfobacillus benefaciens]
MMTEYVMPLDAIVGQEQLKLALALTAISPAVGGVLIQGERGNAKSTTVRSFSHILPEISIREGCPYHCDPDYPIPFCPVCGNESSPVVSAPAPFVELPLGATEDRILGHLDLEEALKSSHSRFVPGLLAKAHRGILYMDEVNLLDDQLIDLLLDAASSGRAFVERDGFSLSYPARFVLVGTMNPDEGEIRPQLLDRFGLSVQIVTPQNIEERVMITQRRLEFERGPGRFLQEWEKTVQSWRRRLVEARERLLSVEIRTDILHYIAQTAVDAHVEGLRADIVMAEASRAYAALCGRGTVKAEDVDTIAPLVLLHRRRPEPPVPPKRSETHDDSQSRLGGGPDSSRRDGSPSSPQRPSAHSAQKPNSDTDSSSTHPSGNGGQGNGEGHRVIPVNRDQPDRLSRIAGPWTGEWNRIQITHSRMRHMSRRLGQPPASHLRGRNRRLPASRDDALIDWPGTLLAGVRRQHLTVGSPVGWRHEDLTFRQSKHGSPVVIVFVVDTSASMGSLKRLGSVKHRILKIAQAAYRKRVHFALLTFGHREVKTLLYPSNKVGRLRSILEDLPAQGDTPLWDGLWQTANTLKMWRRQIPWFFQLYLMTDGKLPGLTTEWDTHVSRAQQCLSQIRLSPVSLRVIDADTSRVPLFWAYKIAGLLGAPYERLDGREVVG